MIGYYVHHHGLGHRTRAQQIALRLTHPVVGFSSLPAPDGWPGEWVLLPEDTSPHPLDPTANGVFHWAPLDHEGHRERMGAIVERLRTDVSAMVVDTSAEVTFVARLMGVRTAVMAMRGDRRDRPHEAAYDAATVLIAPWPADAPEPTWPQRWLDKTVHVGALSRFDNATPPSPTDGRSVLVMWGAGGTAVAKHQIDAARAATPDWTWTVRTADAAPSPDLWRELATADVVVTHGGQNSVAELAAAGKPAVIVAQPRPFDEQLSTVAALRSLDICPAVDAWPASEDWPDLLAAALRSVGWHRWTTRRGAGAAAQRIDRLAQEAS